MNLPDTRASLILRLPDASDVEAWNEFVEIYRPIVYRVARKKGLQDADAQELVQDVLLAVSRAIERWDNDPVKGRFRDWLYRIAQNLTVNYLTRPKHRPIGSGDSSVAELLEAAPSGTNANDSALIELEYRRELFLRAADVVRPAVKERTWSAFWRSSVDGVSPESVAKELGMTVGSVYIARSRVMARIRDEVSAFRKAWADDGKDAAGVERNPEP